MERIDLFVRVMSLKETGPLLFLEDLSKEGGVIPDTQDA